MTDRHSTKKFLKIIFFSIILLCLFIYTAFEIHNVIFGPKIEILSPKNGSLITTSSIEIIGLAKNIKEISLNDRKIFIDEKGNFKEKLLLLSGYNNFIIKASDKFGKNKEKTIEVIYRKEIGI